jgi:hypothetical protein
VNVTNINMRTETGTTGGFWNPPIQRPIHRAKITIGPDILISTIKHPSINHLQPISLFQSDIFFPRQTKSSSCWIDRADARGLMGVSEMAQPHARDSRAGRPVSYISERERGLEYAWTFPL